MLLEESTVWMVQSCVRKQETGHKHTQVHWDTCDASQPPAFGCIEPAVCAASVHGSPQAAVRNRAPLGRCETSREGASTTRDCLSEKAVGYSGA